MKKYISMVMAVAAMAFTLAACSSEDNIGKTDGTATANDLKVNITVAAAGDDGVTSRALIKSGWATGDQIKIWYGNNFDNNPDLVIKYDNTSWVKDNSVTLSGKSPSSMGTLKAVYSAGDNSVIVAANSVNFTYSNNTLTANINNWEFLSQIQINVKGLTSANASQYKMACSNLTPCTGYSVWNLDITANPEATKGAQATGVATSDGVAFVFYTNDAYGTANNYKFRLYGDGDLVKEYNVVNTMEEVSGHSKIKAITIDKDRFSPYVTVAGIKWALQNIGATNGDDAVSWYGDYFAWGEVKPYAKPTFSDYKTISAWNWQGDATTTWGGTTGTKSGYDWNNYCGNSSFQEWSTKPYDETSRVLTSAYDAATANWGTGWRMPKGKAESNDEFKKLTDACNTGSGTPYTVLTSWDATTHAKGIYWVTNYQNIKNLNGMVFCDGTNYVFFPAAGQCESTSLMGGGSYGFYWPSSLGTSTTSNAYDLNFYSTFVYPAGSFCRYFGFTIRPVSD